MAEFLQLAAATDLERYLLRLLKIFNIKFGFHIQLAK